jgi:DtxR family Mn-dependent transcriptional regulator
MANSPALSTSVEDYLKAIHVLAEDGAAGTNELAARLGVTAPSVTGMLNKLAKLGLVTYERYRGANLTPEGRREALRLLRRHRLIETFLIDYLDYSWDEVHEEAELMEHTMTERFTERLAEKLGQPAFDPHGDPIPTADGALPRQAGRPLTGLGPGERLEVTRILSQESEVLTYLLDLGVRPGVVLDVEGVEPFGRLFRLSSEGRTFALSAELAEQIEGQRLP